MGHFHPLPAFGFDSRQRQELAQQNLERISGEAIDPLDYSHVFYGNCSKIIGIIPLVGRIAALARIAFGISSLMMGNSCVYQNGRPLENAKVQAIVSRQYANHIFRGALDFAVSPLLMLVIDLSKWAIEKSMAKSLPAYHH